MKRFYYYLIPVLIIISLLIGLLAYVLSNKIESINEYYLISRLPRIRPDYCNTVIPPNIAPLNFVVEEKGSGYFVKIYSQHGQAIKIFSKTAKIIIPEKAWHNLLSDNKGGQLHCDIFVKKENNWNLYETITNKIAQENIDNFLVYRKILPGHSMWNKMGVYQRNLYNYDELPILKNTSYNRGCVNCHTFLNNRTDKMFLAIRSSHYKSSSILIEDGTVSKIGTKFGYTSWHPSGRLAVYTAIKVRQFFHSAQEEVRDVIDLDSLLACYMVESKTVKIPSIFSEKNRLETYPTWSPDGNYLYFCSAPILWSDGNRVPPERFGEVKYDLVRVSYDLESDQWGEPETILSAQDTGLSILEPRISPDGRWLLVCMCNYGCFPVFQLSSDLYLIDLKTSEETGQYKYRRLEINSDKSESWHSWSSNSRWIAFSSKRDYGEFTRSYFSYIDTNGELSKPLLLPQKDPTFYDSCLETYSVPEFIIEPVRARGEKIAKAVRGEAKIEVDIPITMATPKAESSPKMQDAWQERE